MILRKVENFWSLRNRDRGGMNWLRFLLSGDNFVTFGWELLVGGLEGKSKR